MRISPRTVLHNEFILKYHETTQAGMYT